VRYFLALSLSLLFGAFADKAQADLIVNGDFETGNYTSWSTNFIPPNSAALIISESDFPNQGRIRTGIHSVDFSVYDVPATAILSQTFATQPGARYTATFDFGTYAWRDRSPSLVIQVLGGDGMSVLASETLSRPGINPVNSPPVTLAEWSSESLTFIADGTSSTLRFRDTTSPSFASDALLDNVSVSNAVPEPASILIAGLGILVVAPALRRRSRWACNGGKSQASTVLA